MYNNESDGVVMRSYKTVNLLTADSNSNRQMK